MESLNEKLEKLNNKYESVLPNIRKKNKNKI